MSWLAGLVRHRPARLVGPAAGTALAVALLAATATFLAAAKATGARRDRSRAVAVARYPPRRPGPGLALDVTPQPSRHHRRIVGTTKSFDGSHPAS
jgi:hypothetical protein